MYAERGDSFTVGLHANCSSTTVLSIVRKAGGVIKPAGGVRITRRLRHLTAAQVCERYRAGESGPVLARAAGCDTRMIYETLEAHGIPRRRPWGSRRGAEKVAGAVSLQTPAAKS